jgi:hypothetical protein
VTLDDLVQDEIFAVGESVFCRLMTDQTLACLSLGGGRVRGTKGRVGKEGTHKGGPPLPEAVPTEGMSTGMDHMWGNKQVLATV